MSHTVNIISHLCRWWPWGSKKWGNSTKVRQLVNGGAGIRNQICWLAAGFLISEGFGRAWLLLSPSFQPEQWPWLYLIGAHWREIRKPVFFGKWGLEGEPSVPPLPLPPQQQVGMVMDEVGENADWFLGLTDKVSYASWSCQTEEV